MSLGLPVLAEAQTAVRMCHDDENLYLHFTCDESILSVVGQRRGEFLAGVTERDGAVYADDSVAILLDPANTGRQVHDVTVNALGTIADAHCPGPDLWATRDVTWDSGARAVGIMDGGETVVMTHHPLMEIAGRPTWRLPNVVRLGGAD